MLRLALLLLVGLSFFDNARAGFLDDIRAKALAERAAEIKAGKMPPVKLNNQQIAKLATSAAAPSELSRIAWVGAGRQKDGKIFVCYVTVQKRKGEKDLIRLYSGTFGKDGSYQQTWSATFADARIGLRVCHSHGLVPPILIGGRQI